MSKVDRMTIEGKKILQNVIFNRDKSEGGFSMETVGPQGSGKTSLDLHIIDKTIEKFRDELLFFRDSTESPVQFNRIDKWHIYGQEGMKLKFRDYDTNKYFNQPVTYFTSFDDIYENAEPGIANVIYFIREHTWIDFLNYLRRHMHRGSGWKTVFLEEYEDIAPQYAKSTGWKKNQLYSKNAKNIRKGLVNTLANTQNKSDVSYFIRTKLMIRSYLRGAKVDDISPIQQKAVDKLKMGEALIDYGTNFGKITFDPYRPKQIFEVEKVIEIEIVDEEEQAAEKYKNKIKKLERKLRDFEEIMDRLDIA